MSSVNAISRSLPWYASFFVHDTVIVMSRYVVASNVIVDRHSMSSALHVVIAAPSLVTFSSVHSDSFSTNISLSWMLTEPLTRSVFSMPFAA